MLSCQITKQACLTPALFLELARGREEAGWLLCFSLTPGGGGHKQPLNHPRTKASDDGT